MDADSNMDTTQSPVQEALEETVDKKKKKPKQKVGFRDRKVFFLNIVLLSEFIIIIILKYLFFLF